MSTVQCTDIDSVSLMKRMMVTLELSQIFIAILIETFPVFPIVFSELEMEVRANTEPIDVAAHLKVEISHRTSA